MNNLYKFGRLYWILRDTGKSGERTFTWGFMRQTSPPWSTGRGPQIRIGKYVLQVGICSSDKELTDESGLLYAMQGRDLDTPPKDIGDW
jgi:hypothetical protein